MSIFLVWCMVNFSMFNRFVYLATCVYRFQPLSWVIYVDQSLMFSLMVFMKGGSWAFSFLTYALQFPDVYLWVVLSVSRGRSFFVQTVWQREYSIGSIIFYYFPRVYCYSLISSIWVLGVLLLSINRSSFCQKAVLAWCFIMFCKFFVCYVDVYNKVFFLTQWRDRTK